MLFLRDIAEEFFSRFKYGELYSSLYGLAACLLTIIAVIKLNGDLHTPLTEKHREELDKTALEEYDQLSSGQPIRKE